MREADERGRIDADANPFDKHVGACHGAATSTVLPQSWKAAENVGTAFAQRHATVRNACAKEGHRDAYGIPDLRECPLTRTPHGRIIDAEGPSHGGRGANLWRCR